MASSAQTKDRTHQTEVDDNHYFSVNNFIKLTFSESLREKIWWLTQGTYLMVR